MSGQGDPGIPTASRFRKDGAFRLALLLGVTGLIVSVFVSAWLWGRAQREADAALETRGSLFVESATSAVASVVERLVAVGGLYQASEEVTQVEFQRFVANFEPIPGLGGVGYMPVVSASDLEDFEVEVGKSIPGYTVFELDDSGNRVPVTERSEYAPLQWFEPAEAFDRPHGFDSFADPDRRAALERARASGDFAVSTFLRLVSEDDSDGFLVYWPVTDPETGAVAGFTVAPMDLSELLDARISSRLGDDTVWSVVDVTGRTGPSAQPVGLAWSRLEEVGGRLWEFTISPREGASFQPDPTGALLLLLAGLLASVLAAVGAYQYRHEREAREELEHLKELTRAKDRFLASISHELRTPLTGVLGFAELLRDGGLNMSEQERRAMISSIADQAVDLSSIIDDLLVAARAELDVLTVSKVPVAARAQVAQVLEAGGPEKCRGIEVVGERGEAYRLLGDPSRVRQILRNLISNACRYGGERVVIRLDRDDRRVSVQVADDGPGLPPEEWERIFEPYYRAHDQESQPAAIGIGLSVARQLARLMDGDLVYSREDGWSVFELTLPSADGVEEEARGARLSLASSPAGD